jgi:diacylglycerol kinase
MAGFIASFGYAFKGIFWVLKTERNFKIQFACGILAVILGLILEIGRIEFAIVMLVIGLVLSLELANTAIEKYLDKYHAEHDHTIGLVKDILAGSVLLASISAATIGILIFANPLIDKI